MKYDLSYLTNPEIFQINRLEAHSDHKYYSNLEEASLKKEMSMRHSLNGLWSFSYSKNPSLRNTEFYKKDFDLSGWNTIKVPGHIQLQGYDKPHYVNTMYPWDGHNNIIPPNIPEDFNPVASYIKKFSVPKDWDKDSVFISFQGVESCFYLWVNGEFVGYSEDSFTPAEFDISKYLINGENTLAVQVFKWCSGSWLEDQDFWRFSGIFRDVYLYTKPPVHIEDMFITTDVDFSTPNCKTDVTNKLKIKVKNNTPFFIEQKIFGRSGSLAASSKKKLINPKFSENRDNSNISSNFIHEILELSLHFAELWSAEDPYLYDSYIYITNSETSDIIEVIPYKIGIRKFEIVDKIMKINNKRIVFKGVNRHEFSCHNGRVISEEEMLWDIKFLKANNFNAVRTSHYPNVSRWYELCDEYGLYVIDEANIESHGTWQKIGVCSPTNVVPDGHPKWLNCVIDRGASMLERDKNHPSILIWSCGNESYGGENLFKLSQYFREKDPKRLVHYEGIFWDRRFNDTSDMESRMYAKVHEIEEYMNNSPEKPFILCEYSHAMGNSNGGLHKYVELEEKYPMYQGGFIWDYIDQSLMTKDENGNKFLAFGGDFGDRPTDYNFCVNGLVYGDRRPSPKMQEVKQLFSDFKITVRETTFHIKSFLLFGDLEWFNTIFRVFKDGVLIKESSDILGLSALHEHVYKGYFEMPTESGEYIHEVSIVLNEDTLYAKAGHEVSFGQYAFTFNAPDKEKPLTNEEIKNNNSLNTVKDSLKENFSIEECDVNIGIKGFGFHHIFSKSYGHIVSMKFNDKEFISAPILPNFWRAPTDNDRGNKMSFRYAQWKIASLYAKAIKISLERDIINNIAIISYTYALPTTPYTECVLKYSINVKGEIGVELSYEGVENISELPAFGISFKTPKKYHNIKWYGNGPEETYIDRKHGAKLGIFQNKTEFYMSKYVIPQECGNKTCVRWFELTDDDGVGIKIQSTDNFEFSALPYTAHEIEYAYHHKDLPNSNYTVLNINKVQMGVGGDDSWGAPTHNEYLIPQNDSKKATFVIAPII